MIIYNKKIDSSKLNFSYNNNVLEFRGSTDNEALYAELTFQGSTKRIFPYPDGFTFFYNVLEWFSSIASSVGFTDDLDADLSDSIVYDWTSKSILLGQLDIEIVYPEEIAGNESESLQLVFLNGVVQLIDFKNRFPLAIDINNVLVASPFLNKNNRACFVKYWDGYPMDFSIYSQGSETLNIQNTNTSEIFEIESPNIFNRVFISDGRTDLGLIEELFFDYGINNLNVIGINNFNILFDRVKGCNDGNYIKWRNTLGGYSYWLFHKGNQDRSIKDLGDLNNDFNNILDTVSQSLNLGKESEDTLTVAEYSMNEFESSLLVDILESPAVFLFTGQRYAKNNFNDWVQIKLKAGNKRVSNAKKESLNLELSFELPTRNTIKL